MSSAIAEMMLGVEEGLTRMERAAPASDPEAAARVERAKADFEFFCRTYLPHYFTKPFSRFHHTVAAEWERPEPSCIIAPRKHGKSTIAKAFILRAVLTGRSHYAWIIRANYSDAVKDIDAIRTELEQNQLLRADFGDQMGDRHWSSEGLLLANGAMVEPRGVGGKIRGGMHREHAPDLVQCDDLEDDEHVASREQRDKIERAITRKILPSLANGAKLAIIGTVLHFDAALIRISENPAFRLVRFEAVDRWASATDLWDIWREVYTDRESGGPERAFQFFSLNEKAMLAGTKVLWPGEWDYYRLMEKRQQIGSLEFAQEFQNDPRDPKTQVFKEEWIRYYQPEDIANLRLAVYAAVDPSARSREQHDFFSMVTVGVTDAGWIAVLDAYIERVPAAAQAEVVLRKYRQFQHLGIAIETNAYQVALAGAIYDKGRVEQLWPPLIELTNTADKVMRISSIAHLVEQGTIRFLRSQTRLIEQLVHFPKDNDDGPDTLEMVTRVARAAGQPALIGTGISHGEA
ncbi:MAG TPA: hypothetical protein VM487_14750, partial [Phycisphaerae bacterium]|nr:hypothetical protein [Phycisphaerae bacterium]